MKSHTILKLRLRMPAIMFCLVLLSNSWIYPQGNKQGSSKNESSSSAPSIYVHLFGGMGVSYLSSSDIDSYIGDDFGIGIGIPTWSYGIRGGFRNIFQIEFNKGDSSHEFNKKRLPEEPEEMIKMDYDTKDWQVKINPIFWKRMHNKAGASKAYFLVIGRGDVEWMYESSNGGFKGTSQIYGLEYSVFSKKGSGSVSLKTYVIDFKTVFNRPFEGKAYDFILELKLGFGYGI